MNTPLLNIAKMALISCGLLALAACGGGGGYGGGGGGGGGGGTAPSALTYTGSTMVTVGTAITSLSPTVTGTVTSYSVSPALPAGLTLNTTSGVVSGTPTAATAQATYTITAMNSYGSTTFPLVLTVNSAASVTVPNVVGNTKTAATTAITGAGLVVGTVSMQSSSTVASGNVISESPAAGTSVANGSAVNLVVSSGAAGAGFTISGTVSGPWVAGVTVTLSGAGTGTATTDASGNYSISGLAAGTYMVKPSLAGYTYNPSAPSVAVTANSTQNFTASSALVSYSISGTVSYAGSKTGRIIVGVLGNCTGCNQIFAGTSVTLSSGQGTYTIRGLSNNSYVVAAEMDTLGTGATNASDPLGIAPATIAGGNVTGVVVTLADPAAVTPMVPTGLGVSPGDASALIQYQPALNTNGQEIGTSYKVYWGTDVNASTGGGSATFGALGRSGNVYLLKGLTNGPVYFKLSSLVGATESATSAVVGPVTIGATTGANTVSGAITFPGLATGPMYVGVYGNSANTLYFQTIANPVSPQSYSVAGVPNGSYQSIALIDMNNDGVIDTGDITNVGRGSGAGAVLTISGNTTSNLTLSGASALATVTSNYSLSGANSGYNIDLSFVDGTKHIVAVVLYSGPNVPVPYDWVVHSDNRFNINLGTAVPNAGDTFGFQMTYSDGTTSNLSASLSAVLGASALATSPSVNTSMSRTIPTFMWGAPSSPPPSYTYSLSINGSDVHWSYPSNSVGMPSTQLSVLYNFDGGASKSSLTTGVMYNWQIEVRDAAGNQAAYQTTYTP